MNYIPHTADATKAFVLSLCLMALAPAATVGQNVQHTKGAADQSLRGSFKVDPSTLGLGIQIPLQLYPGRAGLNLPITLHYSSKVWRVRYTGSYRGSELGGGVPNEGEDNLVNYTLTQARYGEDSAAGWTSSLSLPKIVFENDLQSPDEYNLNGRPCGDGEVGSGTYTASDPCNPNNRKTVYRLRLRMPDGSTHELRKSAGVYAATLNNGSDVGIYEAVDDSRLRYNSVTGTVSLPDGSRYVKETLGGQQVTSYVDSNGNKLTFMNDGTVRDTLGRTVTIPRLDEDNQTRTAGDVDYYLPGLGGSLHYVLRWRNLTQVRTDGDQNVYYAGDMLCGGSYRQALSPSLFGSTGDDLVCGYQFNPVVLAEIELPNQQVYKFTYNKFGEIDKVVYPTGGCEVFAHTQVSNISGMGEPYGQVNRGVTERWVGLTATGPLQEPHWHYSTTGLVATETSPDGTLTKRFMHKGNASAFVRFGFDDVRAGMPYEVRVYSPTNTLLRRSLTKWESTQELSTTLADGTPVYAQRSPRISRQVELLLDTGSANPLARTTKYAYGQANEPLNVTAVTEYGYVGVARATAEEGGIDDIPAGTALRSTETVYKDEESYRARNLVALPAEVTVRAGEPSTHALPGPVVARTLTYYDEESYFGTALSPLPCTPGQGRETSTPTVRGNVTTVSRWLDTLGAVGDDSAYIDAHTQYDQCGNARKSYAAAARGTVSARVSEVEYSAEYHSAYPTRTLSPTPDDTGEQGASAPLITSSVFDLNTGLVLSVRDESNYTTANHTETVYSYRNPDDATQVDPLNRLRLITNPDGGWTRFDYGDTPGALHVRTRTALDSARTTDAYQYFDGFGRATRSYAYDGSTPLAWAASEKKYDSSGRVSESSNPVRVASHGEALPNGTEWTTTSYDDLGRVLSVTTPDGAVVSTAYTGATATVTDQALNKRSSVSDALGRLTDIYEDPDGLAYHTSYQYDALGNLRTVSQGAQTRTFVYDSLGRLTSATHPEACQPQGAQCVPVPITYDYNADGSLKRKTDPRGVKIDFEYDRLGRVKSRSYLTPAGVAETPTVTYKYDGAGATEVVPNLKGRLTRISSSVSTYSFDAYDVAGRVKASTQTTAGQTYTLSYEYDLAGHLKKETYPSGRKMVTAFDAAGRVASLTGTKSGEADKPYASQITYTPHGAVSQLKLGNGLWEYTLYNNRLQPREIGLGTPASEAGVLKLEYGYGIIGAGGTPDAAKNNGNLRSQTITVPGAPTAFVQTYLYDELNRLKSAEEKTGTATTWKQVYTFDRYGNRGLGVGTTFPNIQADPSTGLPAPNPLANPTITPSNNRINSSAPGQGNYLYDAAGNLTRLPVTAQTSRDLTYDAENKQVKADGGAAEGGADYSYDGDGRRVRKVVGAVTTVFVYDAAGRMVAEYSNQPGAGGTRYLTQDHLGSTRVVTDAQGNAHSDNAAGGSRHDYLPFGEEVSAGTGGRSAQQGYNVGDGISQKFTGKERDAETGLDYFGARYYLTTLGRFNSCDPVSLSSEHVADPQRWNLFAYVENNPLAIVDPDGRDGQGNDGKKTITVFLNFAKSDLEVTVTENGKVRRETPKTPDWNALKKVAGEKGYELVLRDRPSGSIHNDVAEFEKAAAESELVVVAGHTGVDNRDQAAAMVLSDTDLIAAPGSNYAPSQNQSEVKFNGAALAYFGCDSASLPVDGMIEPGNANAQFVAVQDGDGAKSSSILANNQAAHDYVEAYVNSGGNLKTAQAAAQKVYSNSPYSGTAVVDGKRKHVYYDRNDKVVSRKIE